MELRGLHSIWCFSVSGNIIVRCVVWRIEHLNFRALSLWLDALIFYYYTSIVTSPHQTKFMAFQVLP
jgi:hypothetical protein